MREFKFRLVLDGEIVGYELHKLPGVVLGIELFHSIDGEEWFNVLVDPSRWIEHNQKDEFTGLHDKNGKEIYEGNITNYGAVKWFDYLSWDSGGSGHPGFYFDLRTGHDLEYHVGFFSDIEVIGNIHENPELLR